MTDALVITGQEAAAKVAKSRLDAAKRVLAAAESLNVNTPEMYAFVDDKLGQIVEKRKAAEYERDEIAVPAYTAYKKARKWFAPAIEIYDSAITVVKNKMQAYRAEEQRRIDEEARVARVRAEAERRKERERLEEEQRKEAEAAAERERVRDEERQREREKADAERKKEAERQAVADEEERKQLEQEAAAREVARKQEREKAEKLAAEERAAEAAHQAELNKQLTDMEQTPLPIVEAKSAVPAAKNTTTRREWKAVIIAANLVPHEYRTCEPNISAINKYAREKKDKATMLGVKFVCEEKPILKGRRK